MPIINNITINFPIGTWFYINYIIMKTFVQFFQERKKIAFNNAFFKFQNMDNLFPLLECYEIETLILILIPTNF